MKEEADGVFSKPDDVFVQYFLGDKLELPHGLVGLTHGSTPALARVRLRESIAQTHHLASKIHRDPPPSPYSE